MVSDAPPTHAAKPQSYNVIYNVLKRILSISVSQVETQDKQKGQGLKETHRNSRKMLECGLQHNSFAYSLHSHLHIKTWDVKKEDRLKEQNCTE